MTWTDAKIARLKVLHAEGGLSAAEMAYRMNRDFHTSFSRNAIIGKLHRIGLRTTRPQRTAEEIAERKNEQRRVRRAAQRKPLLDHAEDIMQAEPCDLPPDSSEFAVTFAQLAEPHCRWPIGDPSSDDLRYCGAEKMADGPYCARHHRLAYTRPTRQSSARWAPTWRVA